MLRRFADVSIAIVAIPVLLPLFLVISIAVVLEFPGNPFYGGWRVGRGGKRFRMWKFRTMVSNADRIGSPITTPSDPRITRVGSVLRKTKLDELPQFLNLLLGDTTLIGPRPETPSIVTKYTLEQKQILRVKPGITGPVQIRYTDIEANTIPNDATAEQFYVERLMSGKLSLDLEYLENRTFFSDCQVVLETIKVMARALANSFARQ